MQILRERECLWLPITNRSAEGKVEIGGVTVKCIASNIRRYDIPWESYQLVVGGNGKERLNDPFVRFPELT